MDIGNSARSTVIAPSRGLVKLQLQELWTYRELVYLLTWREVKVRYKQTAIGAAWAILQPLLAMLIFALFFGRLAKMPSDGVPYAVFSLAGLVPWTFFANALSQSANSVVASSNLITKVYFPRLAVPISAAFSGVIDVLLGIVLLGALMLYYGIVPGPRIVFLPGLLLLALVASLGAGIWLAALNVEYRDVRYVIPFLTQFWMLATPIAYPSSLLSEPWRAVYGLNPMVGVVDGFRWALFGNGPLPSTTLMMSIASSLVLLFSGTMYFRQMEKNFADVV